MNIGAIGLVGLAALSLFDCVATAEAQPVSPFAGFYTGVDLGYGVNTGKASNIPNSYWTETYDFTGAQTDTAGSLMGGFYGGYNLMISPVILVGLETDFNFGRMKSSTAGSLEGSESTATYSLSNKLNWSGSTRGRIGVTQHDWLVYATGGLAYADISSSGEMTETIGRTTNTYGVSIHGVRTGWIAGIGFEFAITPNLLLRSEYLHADYGSKSADAVSEGTVFTLKSTARTDEWRMGLAYHF